MRDIAVRAAKTFVQTFIAAFVLPATISDAGLWKSAAIAAAAAAISATWNTVQGEVSRRRVATADVAAWAPKSPLQ